MAKSPKKFRLGKLTEDDFDQDYEPGRSEKTMSPAHKDSLDAHVTRTKEAASRITKADDQIVVVLERE